MSALVASNEDDRRDDQDGQRIVVRSPSVRTGIQPAGTLVVAVLSSFMLTVFVVVSRAGNPLNVLPRAASATSDHTSFRRSEPATSSPFGIFSI